MSKSTGFALAAAAVLAVVAVIGINLVPPPGQIGGADPTPTTAPAATPQVTAQPSPTSASSPSSAAVRMPQFGELAAGTYYIDRFTQGARLTLTMPAGWAVDEDIFLTKGPREQPGEVLLTPWWVTHVFTDACQWDDSAIVDVRASVDDFVVALAEQESREASAPTEINLGGYPATRIELTVPTDLDTSACTNGNLRYWPGPGPDFNSGLCCNPPGNTDVVYVVDVDGKRIVIVARHYPDSSAENRAELQAIVDSIQIEP